MFRFAIRGAPLAGLSLLLCGCLSFGAIATRGTAILADTWNGAECYALLKAFYSARSRIVHSGKTLDELCSSGKLGRRNVHEFVALCRRATREILRFYLDRVTSGVALKDVNREVEDLIVQRVGALNA